MIGSGDQSSGLNVDDRPELVVFVSVFAVVFADLGAGALLLAVAPSVLSMARRPKGGLPLQLEQKREQPQWQ